MSSARRLTVEDLAARFPSPIEALEFLAVLRGIKPCLRENEYKAFQEFIAQTGLRYEYLLFSPFSKQAAVIITS